MADARRLIAPIVFRTVVIGIAKMGDISKVGKVAIKALICFEMMTTVALAIAMVIGPGTAGVEQQRTGPAMAGWPGARPCQAATLVKPGASSGGSIRVNPCSCGASRRGTTATRSI